MQKIKIITIGKLKNSSLKSEIEDLKKRISKLEIIELKEIKEKNIEILKKKEYELLKPYVQDKSKTTYLLWEHGKEYTTQEFNQEIKKSSENQQLQFIITGAFGPNEQLKSEIQKKLSLSKMTFTHEQALYMLVEQIYRHYCFDKNINYTK